MALLCPAHGMIDVVAAGNRCPRCGITALDPLDPANRDAVAGVTALHATRSTSGWKLVLAVGLLTIPIAIAALTTNQDVQQLVTYAIVIALVVVAVMSLGHSEWRIPTGDPHAIRSLVTSTTIISMAICVAFVPITYVVGIDALAYARGDAPWRLLTSAFTHGGLLHLLGNMFALLLFGVPIDRRVGRLRTAIVLAVAAIAGSLAQSQYSAAPGVGFSGAIYGLFGATLALMPRRPQLLTLQMVVVPMPTWGWMLVFVPAYTALAAFDRSQHIGWVAHLGGLFAGLLVALPMRRVPPSQIFITIEERRSARIAAMVKRSVSGDLGNMVDDDFGGSTAGVSNPEIREFIVAARRRKIAVTAIGAAVLVVIGLGVAGLALWLQVSDTTKAKRVNVMVVGLAMAVAGFAMFGQVIRAARRR